MNAKLFTLLSIPLFLSFPLKEEPIEKVVERGLTVSAEQSLLLAKELESKTDRLPRSYENGELKTADYKSWVSGFFPGVLWYLYENTPTEELRRYAEIYTNRVEQAKYVTNHHDVGFMLYCSFGNGYRLTGNESYLEIMKTGAQSLATRYNPKVELIKSWNTNSR